MAAREDGEFELILGNRQLLAVLFIVIVLLGVFFVMGFLAGRSTSGVTVAQNKATERGPLAVDSATTPDPNPPLQAEQLSPKNEPVPTAEEPRPEPKKEEAKPEPVKEAPKKEEPKKEEPKKETKKEREKAAREEKAEKPAKGGYSDNPPSGKYLQAGATRRADAENMLAFITSKTGLHGYVTPSKVKAETFRVILGPLAGNSEIAEARVKLSGLGIKDMFVVPIP